MKILIISSFFPPVNSIASDRPYSWAKTWSNMGHQITVLTTKKTTDPSTDLSFVPSSFEVVEVPLPRFFQWLKKRYQDRQKPGLAKGKGTLKGFLLSKFEQVRQRYGILNSLRMPDITDLWVGPALKQIDGRGPWDLVISTSGPYAMHRVAHHLKKRGLTKKWAADFRDLWAGDKRIPGLFPFNLIESWLEPRLLRLVDSITTVSQPLAIFLQDKYPLIPVYTIENGFDRSLLDFVPATPAFPDDGKIRIVYTGNIFTGSQNPRPLFEAISEMRHGSAVERLEILFVGNRLDAIGPLVKQYWLEPYVKVLGSVKRECALQMQRDAFALLFLPWADASHDGVLTGKIFEYLHSGTPILAIGATHLESSQRLILEAKGGVILGCDKMAIKEYLSNSLKVGSKPIVLANQDVLARYQRDLLAKKLLQVVAY